MNIENIFNQLENLENDVSISNIEFVDDDYTCKENIRGIKHLKERISNELIEFENIRLSIDSIKNNLHILKVLTNNNVSRFLIETK
jgi:hypothetical protein